MECLIFFLAIHTGLQIVRDVSAWQRNTQGFILPEQMAYTEYISVLLVTKDSSLADWISDSKLPSLLQHPFRWPMRGNKRIMFRVKGKD